MKFTNLFQSPESGAILGQRHLQIFMLFTAIVINYIQRYSINITVVAIADEATVNSENTNYKWTQMEKSYVLSSFFWGYCLTQFPGGYLCRRFGVKTILLISTFGSTIATFFPPTVGGRWVAFCIIRTIQGLFQGSVFPAVHAHLAVWCPKKEHNRLGAIVNTGIDSGILLSMYVSGMIAASSLGWRSISYFSATLGLAWCVLWLLFAANTPKESHLISATELHYIESSKAAVQKIKMSTKETTDIKIPVPWKAILTSWPFIALIVVRGAESWGLNTLIAEMPSYMSAILDFEMKNNAIFSALPFLVMLCMSYVFLISSDLLMGYRVVTLHTLRMTFNSIALFSPAIGLTWVGFLGRDQKILAIILFTVSISLNAGQNIGSALNTLDLSPNNAGILMGIINTFAAIIPVVTPIVVGVIVDDETDRSQWQIVFIISAAIFAVSNIFYIFVGSTELQPWDARDFLTRNENISPVDKDNKQETVDADQLKKQQMMKEQYQMKVEK